jgi:aminoglycoside phosphotransferase (APT) family kinase protein
VFEGAIAWAELAIGSSVREVQPLRGGLTSTMLALMDESGGRSVLRLMTEEPWRSHGPALTSREQAAQRALAATPVPAPLTLALDPDGDSTGVSAHLMTRLAGERVDVMDRCGIAEMATMLATIHDVRPEEPFRTYQSWAWEAKWVVPAWTDHPASWRRAFEALAEAPPSYQPTFLHRDFGHHNLLWRDGAISGVVDWVETSTGPAWLDAGHAATNLAVASGPGMARDFLASYSALVGEPPEVYWLVMDAVGFLPPPGKKPMFGSSTQLTGLDAWLHELMA